MNTLNSNDLFRGEKVRLTRDQSEAAAQAWVRWQRNTAMKRLLNDAPPKVFSQKAIKVSIEKELEDESPNRFFFHIHTLDDDRLVGFVELEDINWVHGNAWVGIAIGDRENWNLGYGTEALQLLLRYAFDELNLHRVSLDVFSYNHRAMRAYEKAGFRTEGIERAALQREGEQYDIHDMGILRSEWSASRSAQEEKQA